MTRYFISFNDGDMTFPREDLPVVAEAAHAVMREAMEAGVWTFGGGFLGYTPSIVGIDGSVTSGPLRESPVHLGGFAILDVASDTEAFEWAARIAAACRCAQEVRAIMPDAEQDRMRTEFSASTEETP